MVICRPMCIRPSAVMHSLAVGGFDDVGPHYKGRKQPQDQPHQQDYQHIDDHGKLDRILNGLHEQPCCKQAKEHSCRLILSVCQQQDKRNHRHRNHKGGMTV